MRGQIERRQERRKQRHTRGVLTCWGHMRELWNTGERHGRVGRRDSMRRAYRPGGLLPVGVELCQARVGVQCPILRHISLDKTVWLLLTLSSALTVAALPPNALASLCLRNLAHLGHPSPKPTSPWTLLPPSLHSLMRAASGRTPTPLPGIAVARQPRVRYPASLGFGGWEGAVWDKDPGKG